MSCSKCAMDHLISDPTTGETVCSICGLVVQEKTSEIRAAYLERGVLSGGKEPSSLASYNMGLSTVIGKKDIDGKGQKIQPYNHTTIKRLRMWDQRIELRGSKERNLRRAFSVLYALKDKLNLSDATVEKGAYIYRKALQKQLIRGRAIESVVAAAVYIAIGETLTPISLKEISNVSNIRIKSISRMLDSSLQNLTLFFQ